MTKTCPWVGSNQRPSDQKSSTLSLDYGTRSIMKTEELWLSITNHMSPKRLPKCSVLLRAYKLQCHLWLTSHLENKSSLPTIFLRSKPNSSPLKQFVVYYIIEFVEWNYLVLEGGTWCITLTVAINRQDEIAMSKRREGGREGGGGEKEDRVREILYGELICHTCCTYACYFQYLIFINLPFFFHLKLNNDYLLQIICYPLFTAPPSHIQYKSRLSS